MANQTKYSQKLAKRINDLIAGGEHSISAICSLTGISRRTYYKWITENAQFRRSSTRARTHAREKETEQIVSESERGLRMLIQGFWLTNSEEKIEFLEDGTKERTITIITKHVPPCTNSIIFFLTNKDTKNFSTRLKRHVAAKMGYINKAAGKVGARILTMDEAAALGLTFEGL
jgi:hypothetical protein